MDAEIRRHLKHLPNLKNLAPAWVNPWFKPQGEDWYWRIGHTREKGFTEGKVHSSGRGVVTPMFRTEAHCKKWCDAMNTLCLYRSLGVEVKDNVTQYGLELKWVSTPSSIGVNVVSGGSIPFKQACMFGIVFNSKEALTQALEECGGKDKVVSAIKVIMFGDYS